MKENLNIIKFPELAFPQILLISKQFRRDYLNLGENPELLEQSVIMFRVLFRIMGDLRLRHFQKNKTYLGPQNQAKLDLWNEEFNTKDNSYIEREYRVRDFLINGSKIKMKKILQFLMDYKKEEYFTKNAKGIDISTFGGLILKYDMNEKNGNFRLLISSYWAEKIITQNEYNPIVFKFLFNLKDNKQILFILTILEINLEKGTSIDFQTLNKTYLLNYISASKLCEGFLFPIKNLLDTCSYTLDEKYLHRSFNYSLNKTNPNLIDLMPYNLSTKELLEVAPASSFNKLTFRYKISYLKKRHKLDNSQIEIIKTFIKPICNPLNDKEFIVNPNYDYFDNTYKLFVEDCKKENIKSNSFGGKVFLDKIQGYLIDNWNNEEVDFKGLF